MFDKITELFQSGPDVPDLIAVLDLEEWYLSLGDGQREKLHQYSTSVGIGVTSSGDVNEFNMLEQSVSSTSQTAQKYLQSVGQTAATEKDYEFAEQVLHVALEFEDGSASSTHFTYNELIDVYYKQRDERGDAIERCIEYCKRDIELADDFIDEFGEVPRIPSFKRLAIIYEKQDRYEEALDICDRALEIGTTDGTKGGFEGRKERIRKKMKDG